MIVDLQRQLSESQSDLKLSQINSSYFQSVIQKQQNNILQGYQFKIFNDVLSCYLEWRFGIDHNTFLNEVEAIRKYGNV